ncbi:hypothetical protein [Pedobacter frigoris]|uniref:Uncharacterized protein n=1 Tax=Pedobacter frigoris TaxID=2571272 RepID=A0A4U1CD51_9SPHI|nr:hypothetical protein [Pedobacter frigoris]TKC04242.1 hypothetical protein FA047_16735 [Pedobacter frigoris]
MTYNVYIQSDNGETSFLAVNLQQAEKIATVYKQGITAFTLNYIEYGFKRIYRIAFFENRDEHSAEKLKSWINSNSSFGLEPQMDPETMKSFGDEVTPDFIDDQEFGYAKNQSLQKKQERDDFYVNPSRIQELIGLTSTSFDLAKLIRLCEELNDNWKRENYYSVGLIGRSIINHVPPIFGAFTKFDQVVANGPNVSFRKNAGSLNESLRSIADSYTHHIIRKKESHPNEQQVDFRANLDVLLVEIIRILHV